MRFHPDAIENAILIGWLHLAFHIQGSHLYIPSRAERAGRCKFCQELIGAELS